MREQGERGNVETWERGNVAYFPLLTKLKRESVGMRKRLRSLRV
jgi:hypothetical protein